MLLLPLLGALALSVYAKTLMDPDTEEEAMVSLAASYQMILYDG